MPSINPVTEVMHRIRVKLYPGFLPGIKGAYIARTESEDMLNIEKVCAFLVNRGGFTGSYEDIVAYVRLYFEEAMYQLCNGFSIDTGFFSIHPSVGGVFASDREAFDPKKHPVGFTFRIRSKLRGLVEFITVEIEGAADTAGYIHEFLDVDEGAVNAFYVPGDMFIISGGRIKVSGDSPDCGVYFVPVDDHSKEVKVERLAENTPAKIIGRAPKTGYRHNRIVIRTCYAGSGSIFLKEPRTITGGFTLEEV